MLKKLLLPGMMLVLVLAFAGCGQTDSAEVATTENAQSDIVDVELTEAGETKIKVIKVIRETTGLGLKEAKALVDDAPSIVMEDASQEQAQEFKAALEEVGATVTLK
ncbi:MAG: ribosomal protein L7/L12 [Lachnospiraceae bacterium]|nr:ribosomal protein L7/L12 [Lachnospiraceae bacterium]